MSPDARLIAASVLLANGASYSTAASDVSLLEKQLATQFPDPERGIRGMVPVGYLKDVIEGFIYRLEAMPILGDAREAMEYAKRRRADVENL